MSSRAEQRQLSQLLALQARLKQPFNDCLSLAGTIGDRNPQRGTLALNSVEGGTADFSSLSTSLPPKGQLAPLATLGKGGNYVDARP